MASIQTLVNQKCASSSSNNIVEKKLSQKVNTPVILNVFQAKLKALPEVRAVANFEARLNIISQTLTLQIKKKGEGEWRIPLIVYHWHLCFWSVHLSISANPGM